MGISYKKLWKLLIDKDMNKGDLQRVAGISTTSVAKLTKGENIQTDILVRICYTLNCNTSDIMEFDRENVDLSKLSGGTKMARSSAYPAKNKDSKINGGLKNG
ncbi:hypothetical protein FACS189475_00460 [Betaproteobacteria bacterium]|nr:hypothetical protein FACS189475_00460 [Betaproteobacteria bacterium]